MRDQLIAVRDRYHSSKHPLFDRWEQGELTRRQMGEYIVQHYLHTDHTFRQFGVVYSRAPQDVQDLLVENLAEELGLLGVEGQQPQHHRELMIRWARECGINDEEFRTIQPLPFTLAKADFQWTLVYHHPWQVFLAAEICSESQEPGIHTRTLPALEKHYGYRRGDPAIAFFEEHYTADVVHGERVFSIVDRYLDTPDLRRDALAMAERLCLQRWYLLNGFYRHYVEGIVEPLPGA